MISKRRIYMGEFNVLMNGSTYLPLVSGLLRARAEQDDLIRDEFRFEPFMFHTDRLDRIVDTYVNPAVAAFSMLTWNSKLSLRVAEAVKRRYPDCLIVVGGASVPHHPKEFLASNPFIDIATRSEGEDCFTDILKRLSQFESLDVTDFDDIPGASWRTSSGEFRYGRTDPKIVKDLDIYPSPYLLGMFDELIHDHPELDFQAIIETNRGCPFKCTFCYWGKGGLSRKYRFHSIERVKAELAWMADTKIQYVFNADSNFGMHRRDMEIAQILVESKERCGFPEKFRTCYGKNTDEKIFAIGKLFHDHGLEKGITISYQSVDSQVQTNIQRDNIKLSCAEDLQRRFNDSGVPVYTELILGLPGESVASWIKGIDRVLGSGLKNQLFMYICQVFPNTTLADPSYMKRFGIRTMTIDLQEIHGVLRTEDWVSESEDIVVQTDAMGPEDWRRALVLSWMTMTMHSLKLGFFLMAYLVDRYGIKHSDFLLHLSDQDFDSDSHPRLAAALKVFHDKIDSLLAGQGRGCILPEFGGIYWDEEEACFLRFAEDIDGFYEELHDVTCEFLLARGVRPDLGELKDVFAFQQMSIPTAEGRPVSREVFDHNVLEYFDAIFTTEPVDLESRLSVIEVVHPDFAGDLPRFARESILWGRKSGTMLGKMREVRDDLIPRPEPLPTSVSAQR